MFDSINVELSDKEKVWISTSTFDFISSIAHKLKASRNQTSMFMIDRESPPGGSKLKCSVVNPVIVVYYNTVALSRGQRRKKSYGLEGSFVANSFSDVHENLNTLIDSQQLVSDVSLHIFKPYVTRPIKSPTPPPKADPPTTSYSSSEKFSSSSVDLQNKRKYFSSSSDPSKEENHPHPLMLNSSSVVESWMIP